MDSWANQTVPMVQDNYDATTQRADIHRANSGNTLVSPGTTGTIYPGPRVLGFTQGISLSTAGDQSILLGSANYILDRIIMTWVSGTPILAAGGIYTAASKGGTALVPATQLYTALTALTSSLPLTLAVPNNLHQTASTLFFNLTTLNILSAIVDVYVIGISLDS